MVDWNRRWIRALKIEIAVWATLATILAVVGTVLNPTLVVALIMPIFVNVLRSVWHLESVRKDRPDTKKEAGETVNIAVTNFKNGVRYMRDGEILYEGPLDDAPNYVIQDVQFLMKNKRW